MQKAENLLLTTSSSLANFRTTSLATGRSTSLPDQNKITEISIFYFSQYRVAQNKIPHRRICNISTTSGLILKILEAA